MEDQTRDSGSALREAVHKLRSRLQLTQKQAAQQCGITPATWNRVEGGKMPLSRKFAYKLADIARQRKYHDLYHLFAAHADIVFAEPEEVPVPPEIANELGAMQVDALNLCANCMLLTQGPRPSLPSGMTQEEEKVAMQYYDKLCDAIRRDSRNLLRRLFRLLPETGKEG